MIDGDGTGTDYAYMHLAAPSPFEEGDRVYTGQQIGQVGDTGRASGCHLHFEMWGAPGWYSGGRPIDPTAAAEGLGRLLLRGAVLVPLAHVADLQRSIDFYATLGFAVEERYEQEGWLLWCRLRRERAELMLALASEPVHDHAQGMLFYLYVDDLDACAPHRGSRRDRSWSTMRHGPHARCACRTPTATC